MHGAEVPTLERGSNHGEPTLLVCPLALSRGVYDDAGVCVCVSCICYPASCGPKVNAAAGATAVGLYKLSISCPRPTEPVTVGLPISFSPKAARNSSEKKERENE